MRRVWARHASAERHRYINSQPPLKTRAGASGCRLGFVRFASGADSSFVEGGPRSVHQADVVSWSEGVEPRLEFWPTTV